MIFLTVIIIVVDYFFIIIITIIIIIILINTNIFSSQDLKSKLPEKSNFGFPASDVGALQVECFLLHVFSLIRFHIANKPELKP